MTLRKVPAALAAGLLASLGAHTALFGGAHAMGGAFHALFLEAGLTVVVGALVLIAWVAWAGAGSAADGSVFASRLTARFPAFGAVAASALFWYVAGEALEPKHADPSAVFVVAALAVAAWLLNRIAFGIARLLAQAVIAVARLAFAPRTPTWCRRPRQRFIYRRVRWVRRRFARPPPVALSLRA